ncbi:MAG TPA: 50S ribosomal protein L21 [Solirubrobacteraceae bacterium]|nr:50S ribosomal protein L21 [Solirubrobacteraceae bacterium]
MYAIVKTGGKQYRVEEGQWLLVERLPDDDGASIALHPLLVVDGSNVVDGAGLDNVKVEARILAHERGPKLRVVKFKPKRGYKRHNGHRQDLTRIQITGITLPGGTAKESPAAERKSPEPVAAVPFAATGTAPAAEVAETWAEQRAPETAAAIEVEVTPTPEAAEAAAPAEAAEAAAPAPQDTTAAAEEPAAPTTEADNGS